MKNIIIFGFPHCGTTILRCILSHISEIYEVIDEFEKDISEVKNKINVSKCIEENKKYILYKCPYTKEKFFSDEYESFIKIFIIRNPVYVFSSLNKRFNYDIPENHRLIDYEKTLKYYIKYKDNNLDNLYVVRYEDLFENNYEILKNIFDKIQFNYDNTIFCNEKYNNKCQSQGDLKVPTEIPPNTNHTLYRLYQINQPFINNNNINKIDLTERQRDYLKKNEIIKSIYPEINTII